MPERHWRPLVGLPSSFSRRVVVRIAVTHRAGPIVPSDGIHGRRTLPSRLRAIRR
jgi:hypothetical protein